MSKTSVSAIVDFDRIPIAGAIVELDGTVAAVNQAFARLCGRPAARIVDRKVWELAPQLEMQWNQVVDAARDRGSHADELVFDTPDGPRAVEYVAWVRDAGRTVVVGFAIDITRHKRANDAARARADVDSKQRLESLGLVAGGIAHDFNNQLVSVLAEASAVREDPALSDATREALRRIEAAAKRMTQLTRQLLAYAGRGHFATTKLDPDLLIADVKEPLSRIVRDDATLVVAPEAGSVTIEADPGLMRQVVTSLVANASDALRPGGKVAVRTRLVARDGATWWQLEVEDDGIGMDADVLTKIFDPFFSTKPDRHGLGLSAVHGIVRRLGGDIEVDSTPGQGARFRVRLRVVPGAPPRRRSTSKQIVKRASLAGTRVLLADDEPSVRATVRRLLERRGATVVLANDGGEAEARLREGSFGLVVLDVMMPVRNGYEVLTIARQTQPAAAIVLMSGYTEGRRGFGGEDEPDAFLEKPFTVKTLDQTIDDVLVKR